MANSKMLRKSAIRHSQVGRWRGKRPAFPCRAVGGAANQNQNLSVANSQLCCKEHVETPQTVLRLTEDREPGRPRRVWGRPVPGGENAPHDILVEGNAEGQGDLLRDAWTTPGRIPPFHVDDGGDDVLAGSLGARFASYRGCEQQAIFPLRQRSMESQER